MMAAQLRRAEAAAAAEREEVARGWAVDSTPQMHLRQDAASVGSAKSIGEGRSRQSEVWGGGDEGEVAGAAVGPPSAVGGAAGADAGTRLEGERPRVGVRVEAGGAEVALTDADSAGALEADSDSAAEVR